MLPLRLALPLLALAAALPRPAAGQDVWPSRREAAAGVVLLGGALLLDRTLESTVPDGGGTRWEGLSDAANYGGRPQWSAALLGATWGAARISGNRPVADAALHVGAGLAAGGVANGVLKYGVGRSRPSRTDDPFRFHALSGDNNRQSFPSGHAVVAFSLASAVSEEARRPWVTAAAYGAAAVVGWSRVYEDKHWASDVAAGALIGTLAGRGTVRLMHRRGAGGATVALTPSAIAVHLPLR
ncbi:MAG TPA: phosphatase PAP2 family protein [Longimicrobium sp.]|jgi:membrane-associated phospholipid phosphatase|uniref:phosphatase PAP2 family protein n=1 Tax=Longimicrobium sp. TaxID=2029185 RepID=UPI002ED8B7BF